MLRSFCLLGVLVAFAAGLPIAAAQTGAQESESVTCPRGGFSVYYARGEASPSEQALLLIARIGQEASRCRPDRIDLVTEIDSERDGDQAIRVAMARLNNVAETLVAGGYPADRIRLAAQADAERDMRPAMGAITVYFRQSMAEAGEASAPVRPARSGQAPKKDAI
ncbi:MAG: hypothetical protein RIR33_2452 [Pseudomonadota bacterium]|jgi:hypothetical protein